MLISALVLWAECPGAQVGFKLPKIIIAKPTLKVKSADVSDVATITELPSGTWQKIVGKKVQAFGLGQQL